MNNKILHSFIIIVFLCCNVCSYGQGKVTRTTQQTNNKKPQKSTPEITVSDPEGYINGHGYVDLGLPSGTKWATCNVGTNSPSDFGQYFAWGGIKNRIPSELYDVFVESIAHNPRYDAATFNWGENWLLPSRTDFKELIDNCKSEVVYFHGRTGRLFIGPNGQKIFFPFAGILHSDGYNGNPNAGFYWSSQVPPKDSGSSGYVCGEAFLISRKECSAGAYYSRNKYCPVRPISR